MSLRFCPKCEAAFEGAAALCSRCGLPLVERLRRPEMTAEIDRLEAELAEALFARSEDPVHVCPCCRRLFASPRGRCEPCGGLAVETMDRAEHRRRLAGSPLELREPPRAPRRPGDFVRVKTVGSLDEAEALVAAMADMGLELVIGDDALDEGLEGRAGLHVRPADREAAEMLLPRGGGSRPASPRTERLAEALRWDRCGRFRRALAMVEEEIAARPDAPEPFRCLAEILERRGLEESAAEAWRESLERCLPEADDGRAGFRAAVCGFRGVTGRAPFRGPLADRAWRDLRGHIERHPRDAEALLLALEAAAARGHVRIGRELVGELDALSPRLLELAPRARDAARWLGEARD